MRPDDKQRNDAGPSGPRGERADEQASLHDRRRSLLVLPAGFRPRWQIRPSPPATIRQPTKRSSKALTTISSWVRARPAAIVAGELSKTGAKVLVVESGGADTAPTIGNPSIWFYNVGGPLDWKLPIVPVPQLNNRKFNMALGHVLGGGSSINAMVWSRGMERDYAAWERSGAKGWGFKDVLPTYKAQEDWEGGANEWRGAGGPVHIRKPGDPHPTAPAFIEAARQMGFPIVDDANGPMRPGAGYINMNIAADGTRVSSSRAFLRPQPRPSQPDSAAEHQRHQGHLRRRSRERRGARHRRWRHKSVRATREVILAAGTIHSAKLLMLSGVGDADAATEARNQASREFAGRRPEPAGSCPRLWCRLPIQGEDAGPSRGQQRG